MQPTGAKPIFRLTFVGLFCVASLLGCATMLERQPSLPARHAIFLKQLVIHSDIDVPQQHRLLEDLRALRDTVQASLALSLSDEPIHVYLFESEHRFQAFSNKNFPQFPARRAFFVQSDTSLAVYAHWGDHVAEDLRHEVVHGYLHSVLPDIPLWLDEGLAEYFETPRGDAGLNRPHVELLTTALAQNSWQPNLPRLERLSSAGEMTQTDYAESWAWVHLMLQSIPQRREMLQQYLQSVQRDGAREPFSGFVARSMQQPDQVLIEHLRRLTLAPR